MFWEYDARIGRRWNVDPTPNYSISCYSVFGNNPIKYIDIRGDTPTIYQAAQMAQDSYLPFDSKKRESIDGGWTRIKAFKDLKFNDENTGFKSALYSRDANGKTEYAFVTDGTDPDSWKDWKNDIQQAIGKSKQYDFALTQGQYVTNALANYELTFVGHSLGGGEASLNALKSGKAAITFNAAGVSALTKQNHAPLNTKNSSIQAFIIPGEAVDWYQKSIGSTADGNQTYVHPVYGKMGSFKAAIVRQFPQTILVRGYLHTMGAMMKALDASGYKPVPPPPPPAPDVNEYPTAEQVQQTWDGIIHL